MDADKRQKLEARLTGTPIDSSPSRDGNSNLSTASMKAQKEAWKDIASQPAAPGATVTSPSGQENIFNSAFSTSAQALGGSVRKRTLPPSTSSSHTATTAGDGSVDLMASPPRTSPLRPQNGRSQHPVTGRFGDADTSLGGEESESESRGGGAKGMRPIATYFGASSSSSVAGGDAAGANGGAFRPFGGGAAGGGPANDDAAASIAGEAVSGGTNGGKKIPKAKAKIATRKPSGSGADAEQIQRSLEKAEEEKRSLQMTINRLEDENQRNEGILERAGESLKKVRDKLEAALREAAIKENLHRRERMASNSVRLGKIVPVRTTNALRQPVVQDTYEQGFALTELQTRRRQLLARKVYLEERKKALQRMKKRKKTGKDDGFTLDMIAEEAAIKMHSDANVRDEGNLNMEKKILEEEQASHVREYKRIMHEDRSRFNRLPALGENKENRYLMQMILGKGGFSEVWKAYDLVDGRDVAIKIHELNPSWPPEKKSNYIKHVTREHNIHMGLQCPRVVRYHAVFEIDQHAFASVLEYCRGSDLDEKLRREKRLSEKVAKPILLQMMSGVRYLHTPVETGDQKRKAIIHYDLKPANILFDENGDVKITDFGLSKQFDNDEQGGTSMELTSVGTGTYYYLPPETYGPNPRINTKVDVFSLGVIYFQMLVGRKPFGEGRTQDAISRDGTMERADSTQLNWDPVPKVADPQDARSGPIISEDAKRFIKDCLTREESSRPDIFQLCSHPYITKK